MTVKELIAKLETLDDASKERPVLLVGDYVECTKVDNDEDYIVVVLT